MPDVANAIALFSVFNRLSISPIPGVIRNIEKLSLIYFEGFLFSLKLQF